MTVATAYDSRPDTYQHIGRVRHYLTAAVENLLRRANEHDASKLDEPERACFDEFTPKLGETAYGSEEYEACRVAMGEALEHHYAANPHHPEHYPDGVAGMSLLDLVEMLCDWKAASERHNRPPAPAAPDRAAAPKYDSNLARSIEINQERFGYSDELRAILLNTADELGLL